MWGSFKTLLANDTQSETDGMRIFSCLIFTRQQRAARPVYSRGRTLFTREGLLECAGKTDVCRGAIHCALRWGQWPWPDASPTSGRNELRPYMAPHFLTFLHNLPL